jgi:hypothetical protein
MKKEKRDGMIIFYFIVSFSLSSFFIIELFHFFPISLQSVLRHSGPSFFSFFVWLCSFDSSRYFLSYCFFI